MDITCDTCGYPFSADDDDPRSEWKCPICGSAAHKSTPSSSPSNHGLDDGAERSDTHLTDEIAITVEQKTPRPSPQGGSTDRSNPADTVFQPALMMNAIMDELEPSPDAAESQEPISSMTGTELIPEKADLPSPFLDLETQPYILILGARPGEEQRPIVRARTSFGRKEADVNLADPSVSATHFQIEAFGSEFFLRDLESRNGTFLNNSPVRYSQLLAGDQITAGRTTLIFRLSNDDIDRA